MMVYCTKILVNVVASISNPSNISFLGNTDGVALIKSTGWSVWPVYLVVNELPPLSRYFKAS